ncbi:MAG TPA: DUF4307 domain-containing protein [Nocardioides sp.]|nr:DUF4307 domain-containing protein [Nocardioides sp.]
MSSTPDSLAQRYGRPSGTSRLVVAVVAGLIVIALVAWLVWAIAGSADPAVSSQEGPKGHTQHEAWIKYQVKYGDGPVDATCTVRALAGDGEEVGRTSVTPPRDAQPDTLYTITFRTTREADSIEWLGCTAPGQPRPH